MGRKKNNELLLLSHFRRNARESLTKISRKTSIPVSTIFDRLKSYENGLIKKHTVLLDFNKLGYMARANAMLQLSSESRVAAKEFLLKNNVVNSLYKINNGFDYFVELICKDMKELEQFLEDLEQKFQIKQKMVFYIIEDLAREKFMTEPDLIRLEN